jgi:hypothetical protein
MSTELITRKISYKSGADLSTSQYYAVYLSASKTVSVCTGSQAPRGVLVGPPNSTGTGHACEVVVGGITQALLGGTVTVGDKLAVNASGKFVKSQTGWSYCATAEESGVTGDIKSINFLEGASIQVPLSL